MKFRWTSKLLNFYIFFCSLHIYGQNTISVKKTSTTIDAIYISSFKEKNKNHYYCFKKNGYVYYFKSHLKEKKIIRNCQGQDWLKLNSSIAIYNYYQDSIKISPITYSMYEEETINGFYYLATLDSTRLNISAMGKEDNKRFTLLFPN